MGVGEKTLLATAFDAAGDFKAVLHRGAHRHVELYSFQGHDEVRRAINLGEPRGQLEGRAGILRTLAAKPVSGLPTIYEAKAKDGFLLVREARVDGFTLREVRDLLGSEIGVGLALYLVREVGGILRELHARKGHDFPLSHGRLSLDRIRFDHSLKAHLLGFEGLEAQPEADLVPALVIVRELFKPFAKTKNAETLIDRLLQLRFETAAQLVEAIDIFLSKQDEKALVVSRRELLERVQSDWMDKTVVHVAYGAAIGSDDTLEPEKTQPEVPTVEEPTSPGGTRRARIGRYEVLSSIGRGGMGTIYLGRVLHGANHGDLVALKVLGEESEVSDQSIGMLVDEASIMAKISHENVLKVLEFSEDEGRYFMAMEYLEGRPLVRVMIEAFSRAGGIDYPTAAAICAEAGLGLFAAHTATGTTGQPLEVVHRDVSPQNIFVTFDGVVKVLDFGVARASERVSQTEVGIVKGKAAYMSPEQCEGRSIDARSDVFSLGVCVWEMVAGRRLFKAETEYDTLVAVTQAKVAPPSVMRGEPVPELDRIVLAALHRDVRKRTRSAAELSKQLADFAKGQGLQDHKEHLRRLMHGLFAREAAEEKQLVERLLRGSKDDPELDERLGHLSGIVPNSGPSREMTLAGEPSGLIALDRLGTQFSENTAIREVDPRLLAKSVSGNRGAAASKGSLRKGVVPQEIVDLDEVSFELVSMEEELSAAISVLFDTAEHSSAALVLPADPVDAPKKRSFLWVVMLLLFVGLVFATWRFLFEAWVYGPGRAGEVAPAREVFRPSPPKGQVSAKKVAASSATTAEASPRAKQVKITDRLSDLAAAGISRTKTRDAFFLSDSRGGAVTVSRDANVLEMGRKRKSYLIASHSKGLTSLVLVAPSRGVYRVRDLSINDCPADFSVKDRSVEILYKDAGYTLPLGGGELYDFKVLAPRNTDRLTVKPLGLTMGRRGGLCPSGWWGKSIVLRRMPPGEYLLEFVGPSGKSRKEVRVVLKNGRAEGATLLRRTKLAVDVEKGS